MSASPWCDLDGRGELVAQCYSASPARDGAYFWGLARLRLPDATITDRIELDVLPTGRPCWLPERPGQVLFAAGDGMLYRCGFAPPDDSGVMATTGAVPGRPESGPAMKPTPVEWRCPAPKGNQVVISEPIWPVHPRLRRYVFASLGTQREGARPSRTEPTEIWWFRMRPDGMAIEAAGQLGPSPTENPQDREQKHFPNIAVAPDGTIHLVYLIRSAGQKSMRLIAQPLELDDGSRPGPESSGPRLAAGSRPRVLGTDLAPILPVFSADGGVVFAVQQGTGKVIRLPLGRNATTQAPTQIAQRP